VGFRGRKEGRMDLGRRGGKKLPKTSPGGNLFEGPTGGSVQS